MPRRQSGRWEWTKASIVCRTISMRRYLQTSWLRLKALARLGEQSLSSDADREVSLRHRSLNAETRHLLARSGEELFLSAASSWEIAIKAALGKLPLPEPPASYVPKRM